MVKIGLVALVATLLFVPLFATPRWPEARRIARAEARQEVREARLEARRIVSHARLEAAREMRLAAAEARRAARRYRERWF